MQLIGIEDMAMNLGSNDKTFIKSKRELVKRFSFDGNKNIFKVKISRKYFSLTGLFLVASFSFMRRL